MKSKASIKNRSRNNESIKDYTKSIKQKLRIGSYLERLRFERIFGIVLIEIVRELGLQVIILYQNYIAN